MQDITHYTKSRMDLVETAMRRSPLGGLEHNEYGEAKSFQLERKGVENADADIDSYRAYKSAFRNFLRKNNAGSGPDEVKALSVGSDPDGGYWVTPDISGRIASLIRETSPIRQVANIATIGTDALEGVNDLDEATTGWVGETTNRTETASPQIGEWRIPVHEQYAEPRVTQKLLDDAQFDVGEWLSNKIADKLSRMENTAFVNGNGERKPRGFLTYASGEPSTGSWNVIEQVLSGGNGAFATSNPGDNLINMVFSLDDETRCFIRSPQTQRRSGKLSLAAGLHRTRRRHTSWFSCCGSRGHAGYRSRQPVHCVW